MLPLLSGRISRCVSSYGPLTASRVQDNIRVALAVSFTVENHFGHCIAYLFLWMAEGLTRTLGVNLFEFNPLPLLLASPLNVVVGILY